MSGCAQFYVNVSQNQSNSWLILIALSAAVIAGSFLVSLPAQNVVFLDVGQGDSVLLQEKTAQVLVDGGARMDELRRLGEEMPFFDKDLEVIISTHPDRDHLEGLLHVLERYDVKLVLLPQVAHTSQLYAEWIKMLKNSNVQVRFAQAGQKITVDDLKIKILGPTEETRAGKTNNASVLTRVDFADISFLLTGDAEASVENELVQRFRNTPELDIDVLKAGHHGSKTSTSQALLNASSPSAVVISVGADNSYGHPHPTVLSRLTNIQTWRTNQSGSVKFEHVKNQWLLKTAK